MFVCTFHYCTYNTLGRSFSLFFVVVVLVVIIVFGCSFSSRLQVFYSIYIFICVAYFVLFIHFCLFACFENKQKSYICHRWLSHVRMRAAVASCNSAAVDFGLAVDMKDGFCFVLTG